MSKYKIEKRPGLLAGLLNRQFLTFLTIGCSNFLISFMIFHALRILLTGLPWRSFGAQFAAYGVGTVWSFTWNRRLTFRSDLPVMTQATKFVLLQGSLALGSAALIGFGVDHMGFPASPTWLGVMGAITVINFLLCKHWAFR